MDPAVAEAAVAKPSSLCGARASFGFRKIHGIANLKVEESMRDNHAPNVFLRGGPARMIADEERIRYLPDLDALKVKVLCGNRYEHFVASSETAAVNGLELKVFSWSFRTYVAE